MDLKQLKTFLQIAELGSLSKASDRLRVGQPALSRQIRLLEQEIGVALFMRHGRGMQLTEAGDQLRLRVREPLRELYQTVEDLQTASGAVVGRVAYGLTPTVSAILSGHVARRIAADYPGISLRLVEGYSGHQLEWLQSGQVDLAIMYGPNDFHMKTDELLSEDLVLVGASAAGLSPDAPISVRDLSKLPLVLAGRPHGLRIIAENAASQAGVKLNIQLEVDSFRLLFELVTSGVGYTILPRALLSEPQREDVSWAPVIAPKLTRQLLLVQARDGNPSQAVQATARMIKAEIAELVRSGRWPARLLFSADQAQD